MLGHGVTAPSVPRQPCGLSHGAAPASGWRPAPWRCSRGRRAQGGLRISSLSLGICPVAISTTRLARLVAVARALWRRHVLPPARAVNPVHCVPLERITRWEHNRCNTQQAARVWERAAGLLQNMPRITHECNVTHECIARRQRADFKVIHHPKTDQEGRGHMRYLGAPTMQRLAAWLSGAGITAGGPLFRQVLKDGATVTGRPCARSIRSIIAKRAAAAGVAGRVSGHSLRVGSAQSLAAAGAWAGRIAGSGRLAGAHHAGALRTAPVRCTRRRRQAPLPRRPVAASRAAGAPGTPARGAGTSTSLTLRAPGE